MAPFLAACDDPLALAGEVPDALVSQTWTLRRLNDNAVPIGAKEAATLHFLADRRIEGSSTCNRIFSPERWLSILGYDIRWDWPGSEYRWSADRSGRTGRFEPAPMAMTTAGCGEGPADRMGEAFWKRMQQARRWSLHNQQLIVSFEKGGDAVLLSLPARASISTNRSNPAQ
jgi:heat shock protein HslJ